MNSVEKNAVRTVVQLELNACFSRLSAFYEQRGNEEEQAFLAELTEALRRCVASELETQNILRYDVDP